MKILLYIPGLSFDGETIDKGKSLGGSESMGYYVGKELAKRGYDITVFCNTPTGQISKTDNVTYSPIGQCNQQTPYGDNFQNYALNIPHDIIIAQRAAGFFNANYNSKLNYFWTHDLALKRYLAPFQSMLWNVNKILGVSDWHVKQIKDVYKIQDDYIDFLPNGIDLNLYQPGTLEQKRKGKLLFYSSRPERGLVNLVGENGIMEKLLQIDPEIKLIVCGYENTTPVMASLYTQLTQRCEALPNVINYGALSKQELADLMRKIWLHVYPTEFEEVSCITVMEQQACGTPILTTRTAALPETLKEAGVNWSTIPNFVNSILKLINKPIQYDSLYNKAIAKREDYNIKHTVNKLEKLIDIDFNRLTQDKRRLFKHFIHNSDIKAAYLLGTEENLTDEIYTIEEDYDTLKSDYAVNTQNFYDDVARYAINRGDKHSLGNYQNILSMPRVKPLIQELSKLKPGSKVLDYGCCVGQMTVALANIFQDLIFEGCDINADQITVGQNFIEKNNIKNVSYFVCADPGKLKKEKYDAIICAEVLEHIWNYVNFLSDLEKSAKLGAKIYFTTPYGPWESLTYDNGYKKQHLHHFEANDIKEIVGHKKDFDALYINHPDNNSEKFGYYFWFWTKNQDNKINSINYQRKFKEQNPRQQVTACIICKGASGTIKKTLESIKLFVDEIIIAIDQTSTQEKLENTLTYHIAKDYKNVTCYFVKSPLEIGFDEARNSTINKATKDWILWIDADELWIWPERIALYLKDNQYNAYAISQHHFSAEPVGLIKTDLPCRLFRNKKNISFYGVVHEHPELELNKGIGEIYILPNIHAAIGHNGYENENVRRLRFQRNIPLMRRDRQKYPERFLGRTLWLRDLAHENRFEWEQTGQQITPNILKRCNEILEEWRALIKLKQTRFIVDSIQYITETVGFLTGGANGYNFKFALNLQKSGLGDQGEPPILQGQVLNSSDLKALFNMLIEEKLIVFEENEKYL